MNRLVKYMIGVLIFIGGALSQFSASAHEDSARFSSHQAHNFLNVCNPRVWQAEVPFSYNPASQGHKKSAEHVDKFVIISENDDDDNDSEDKWASLKKQAGNGNSTPVLYAHVKGFSSPLEKIFSQNAIIATVSSRCIMFSVFRI
jgi:hypothetical protein